MINGEVNVIAICAYGLNQGGIFIVPKLTVHGALHGLCGLIGGTASLIRLICATSKDVNQYTCMILSNQDTKRNVL